ncbi:phosphatidate cytidylyltransferase [Frateuria aurantia]
MLAKRVLTALLVAPLAILMILGLPTPWFAIPIAIIFLSASWEWARIAGLQHRPTRAALLAVSALAYFGLWQLRDSGWWPHLIALGVAWWLLACVWLSRLTFAAAPTPAHRNLKLLAGALVLFPAWVAGMSIHGSEPHGHVWTLLAMLLVWGADTGAYFSGRYFGRRKLAPSISPGKTWAGAYGAGLAGILIGLGGGLLLGVRGLPLLGLVLLSLLTVAASIVGDLVESLMKRQGQVKDSGNLFPGHGGMLDRMDSVFAALPVFAAGKLLLGL